MNTNYKFYSIKAAAIEVDSSPRMLREYIKDGQLKAYKNMGKWYILPKDLYDFVIGGAVDSATYDNNRTKRAKERPEYLKPKAKVSKISAAQKRQILKELNSAKKKQFYIDTREDFKRRIREYNELNEKYLESLRNAYVEDLPKPKKYDRLEGYEPITEIPSDYEQETPTEQEQETPTPTEQEKEKEPLTIDDIKDSEPLTEQETTNDYKPLTAEDLK